MNIKILSRTKAVKLSYKDLEGTKVIISISDPESERAHFNRENNSIKEVLYLSFYDVGEETMDAFGTGGRMTADDAKKTARFVIKWKDMADAIWINCEAGVSRSAGIALSIMEYLNMDLSPVLKSTVYCPNMLCYELTKKALSEALDG
ncbi:MAG: dual specificity protein phosphatase family protein [Clostridia bacterium]|nr:dual specificity protein phosphatase family protein [Clostridia bacterium]